MKCVREEKVNICLLKRTQLRTAAYAAEAEQLCVRTEGWQVLTCVIASATQTLHSNAFKYNARTYVCMHYVCRYPFATHTHTHTRV